MERTLIIDAEDYNYDSIMVSVHTDKFLVYTTDLSTELCSKYISLLSTDEIISIYHYILTFKKSETPIEWFERNIGFDRLPPEYQFMEM